MSLLFGILTGIYVLIILYFLYGISQNEKPNETHLPPKFTFSIIVPFRNEERHLSMLLNSLKTIDYPRELFEIVLVDDASEDTSKEICHQFELTCPELSVRTISSERKTGAPKKDAITTGIAVAENEYILTTDADCIVPEKWLRALNSFLESSKYDLVSGPVWIQGKRKGFLTPFEQLDFLSLQGITIGAFGMGQPFLCNAANLCYKKQSFIAVNGYLGNETIASGDDVFLLEKFRQKGLKTAYLEDEEAIVHTVPQLSLTALFSQRIRWASKTSSYKALLPKAVGISVFLMNLLLVVGTILYLLGMLSPEIFLYSFLFKFNADFLLLYRTASFFKKERIMRNYFWASVLYPIFCTIVVFVSLFCSFEWKGRTYPK